MAIYKRGNTYYYEFQFQGIQIRKSARTSNRDIAARAERARRLALEQGANVLEPVKRPQVFSVVARQWLESNPHWSANTKRINKAHCVHLVDYFGGMLLFQIKLPQIKQYMSERLAATPAPSNRTVNMEVVALRQVLTASGLWEPMRGKVKWLRTNEEIGRALSSEELHRLEVAVGKSRSRSLPVALRILSFTGMRLAELRTMRWRQVTLVEAKGSPAGLITGKGKAKGGEGRFVPLGPVGLECLLDWRANFPDAKPDHFVFPSERYGLDGEEGYLHGSTGAYDIDPTKPIGSWKTAWTTAREKAGVKCRMHDLRHTFVSGLAGAGTPESTMIALAGWMSRKMLERYSHTRIEAKVQAIAAVESALQAVHESRRSDSPQKSPQLPN